MENTPMILPMIALRGMVVLPDTTVSLEIGREKSIKALEAALEAKSEIFLCAQKDLAVENPSKKDIFNIGVTAHVVQVIKMPDGGERVIVKAVKPAKIEKYITNPKYFLAQLEPFEYQKGDIAEQEALLRRAREQMAKLALSTEKINKTFLLKISEVYDADQYVNLCAGEIIYKDSDKQELLEELETNKRLEKLLQMLLDETEIARVDNKIASRVKKQIDKGQKEYYLKEQIRAISKELGEDEEEIALTEQKIISCKMPAAVEEKALKELRRMAKMSPSSPDSAVIRTYLEWLCDLKWNYATEDNKDLKLAMEILDEDHFGLQKIKERIIEYLAVMQLSGGLHGPILCFVGPPGVGKTSIVKSIARALGRKYVRMSLGGVRDEAEIRGHRRTYIGAMPGKIIYMMKQAGCVNPVLLFDEIDKMSSDFRGDPSSAMLEVLDPEQNCGFEDHYLEAPYDLSKVLFVCTANTVESIPLPLADRMEIIELSGYSEEEKIQIAKQYLVPKQKNLHGIKEENLAFTDGALREIIKSYTRESGVRSLEREVATLCRKIATKQVSEKEFAPVEVKEGDIEGFLGIPRYKQDYFDAKEEVGSATGLAWTAVGGVTLTIDVTLFEGKGDVLLTGMLGDVMKESARAAISLVKSRAKEYGVDTSVFSKTDIHIHIPEGATPKDGPSAGVTMACAIMSAFSQKPVLKQVAMTGEVTLRGKVLPIGGLKEKTLAAYRVGIRKIIIPAENQKDITEIPKEVAKDIEFVLASDISAVFQHALKLD